MRQPELRPLAQPELPQPGILGRALGALFFVVALGISGFGLYNAAHAAGVAGTHGTLAVEQCWVKHGSHGSRGTKVCGGTFRSDDGKTVDDEASVRSEVKPGSRVSVQRAGDGYVRVGFGETARWVALFFLGWLVVAFGMSFAATGMFPRSGMQVALITRAVSGTRVGTVRKWIVRGGLAGAGVCLLLTLLAWLLS
ncbi:hypothetical protein ACIQ6V_25745 [Streptomyces sp. NPDC096198]|uniref:hypothetical protein n=1 Tax=Streptomyces sp. NPDC096198 TaxID=3366080 RepID=UPI0037F2B379